jgi:hypothetical protein
LRRLGLLQFGAIPAAGSDGADDAEWRLNEKLSSRIHDRSGFMMH